MKLKEKDNNDLWDYLDKNPGEMIKCAKMIKIIDVNQATLDFYDAASKEQIIGNLDKTFTENSFAVFKEELIAISKGMSSYEAESEVKTLSGELKYVYLKLKIDQSKPEIFRALLATSDITDRKKAENELKKYREHLEDMVEERTLQLEVANKELEAFAYSVSHDLRAPLRAINGFTEILMEDYVESMDEEAKRLGSVIQKNSQKMGQLIDDLLSFSRLGRISRNDAVIEMKELINAIYYELTSEETRGKINFSIDDLPSIEGDPSMFRQVWINLISNAIKFSSKQSKIEISITFTQDTNRTVFCIKDNGAGFDMKYKNKLFKVFQRLHGVKAFEGTGVGLALVQRIIMRHKGEVWAEGEVDKGATFYFSLPKNN